MDFDLVGAIKKGVSILSLLITAIVIGIVAFIIGGILVGVAVNNITGMPANWISGMNDSANTMLTWITTTTTGIGIGVTLITVVIVLIVFKGFLNKGSKKGGESY